MDYNFGEGSIKTDYLSRRLFLSSNRSVTTIVRDIMVQAETQEGDPNQAAAIERGESVEVRRIGSEVTVVGTNASDQIKFTPASSDVAADSTQHVVEANGIEWEFPAAE